MGDFQSISKFAFSDDSSNSNNITAAYCKEEDETNKSVEALHYKPLTDRKSQIR